MIIRRASFIKSAPDRKDWPPPDMPEVAMVGRANVGKSSLINSLTGSPGLARVSNSPGRTRLINFFAINDAFRLVDLPGYGYSRVSAAVKSTWAPMIESYLKERRCLALVLLLLDARRIPGDLDLAMWAWLAKNACPRLAVITKIDKLSANELARQKQVIAAGLGISPLEEIILFSSHNGRGREALLGAIEGYTTKL